MPQKVSLNDHRIRFLLHRQWKYKIDPENAIKNINKLLNLQEPLSPLKVIELYNRFDKSVNGIFDVDFSPHIFCTQNGKECYTTWKYVSPFLLTDDTYDTLYKKGRSFLSDGITHGSEVQFVLFTHYGSRKSITIYDLFHGVKRTTKLSFEARFSSFTWFGEYALAMKSTENRGPNKIYLLKMDYQNLTVKELEAFDLSVNYSYPSILPDQFDDKRFIVYDSSKFMIGQFENDTLVFENNGVKHRNVEYLYSQRLVGNKVQGFDYGDDLNSLKFCEFNLETMGTKERNVPFNLDNDELVFGEDSFYDGCWSANLFYGLFTVKNNEYHLLTFDPLTLKWTDIKIWIKKPRNFYVNSNEILTIQFENDGKTTAIYQINLRNPDTLTSLTTMAIIRELNIYKNEKYINFTQKWHEFKSDNLKLPPPKPSVKQDDQSNLFFFVILVVLLTLAIIILPALYCKMFVLKY